jgi:hypothetical protein
MQCNPCVVDDGWYNNLLLELDSPSQYHLLSSTLAKTIVFLLKELSPMFSELLNDNFK